MSLDAGEESTSRLNEKKKKQGDNEDAELEMSISSRRFE